MLRMRQSMRPAARGTEGATPNNRATMNAEAAEPCATIDVLQCALGVAPSDDKRKRTRGRGIPGPFFSRRQPDEESYRLSVKQREEELPAGESLQHSRYLQVGEGICFPLRCFLFPFDES